MRLLTRSGFRCRSQAAVGLNCCKLIFGQKKHEPAGVGRFEPINLPFDFKIASLIAVFEISRAASKIPKERILVVGRYLGETVENILFLSAQRAINRRHAQVTADTSSSEYIAVITKKYSSQSTRLNVAGIFI